MSSTRESRVSRRNVIVRVVIIFVVAAAVSATMSSSVSLWTDESVTISAAERSFPELWALVQRIDAVHAVYYAFMSMWVDLFGASPFALRLPSALAAAGTAAGVYCLSRRMTTETTALVAAAAAIAMPRLFWSGIEARPFVFSALAAVWATYLLVVALHDRRARQWVFYAVVAAVGVAVNIYMVLLVVGHAVSVLMLARRDRRALAGFGIAAVSVAVLAAPLLLLVRSQQAQLGGDGDRGVLSILRKMLVNQFFLGETPDPEASALWFTRLWQGAAIVAAAIGLVLIVTALVKRGAAEDDGRRVIAIALPWILVPTLVVALYAVAIAPIYQPRYFTFTAPAAALLLALGIRSLHRRWLVWAVVAAYLVSVSVVYVSQRTPYAKSGADWVTVAQVISEQAASGDAVYFAPRYPEDESPVQMTTRRIEASYPTPFVGLADLTIERTGAESATIDGFSHPLADVITNASDYDRVWGIYNRKALPAALDDADALLAAAGFSSRVAWEGPSTVVVEYLRRS